MKRVFLFFLSMGVYLNAMEVDQPQQVPPSLKKSGNFYLPHKNRYSVANGLSLLAEEIEEILKKIPLETRLRAKEELKMMINSSNYHVDETKGEPILNEEGISNDTFLQLYTLGCIKKQFHQNHANFKGLISALEQHLANPKAIAFDLLVFILDKNETILSGLGLGIHYLSPRIENLTHLRSLRLSRNHLENIPFSMNHFKKLEYLDLSYNNLKSLPRDILTLENLNYLDVSHNDLTVLPKNLTSLNNLRLVDITHNPYLSISEIYHWKNLFCIPSFKVEQEKISQKNLIKICKKTKGRSLIKF